MLRAYCSEWKGDRKVPTLNREEIHHLVRVRRVRTGETIEILNGRGDILTCTVEQASGKELELTITELQKTVPEPVRRHLLVALPKGKTFPTLLHKAVELGVSEITPLLTENSEVPPSRADRKSDRWESVLVEAVKQSGNAWMPLLNAPTRLPEALKNPNRGALRLCAALQQGSLPLLEVLEKSYPESGDIEVFVGPEGDFSEKEYALLHQSGCHFVTLGQVVLKVETAASLVMGSLSLWSQIQTNQKEN
jgi:16S rRNA (uracil1498-N3)-methyltransferase